MNGLPSDITRRKHGGNAQSVAANGKVAPHKAGIRYRIEELVEESGERGLTLHELCARLNRFPHQISGRMTELKAEGKIYERGEPRDFNGHVGAVYVKR